MLSDITRYEYPHSKRVVVIGDIHGDLRRFKRILVDAMIINDDLEWIAQPPETIVVQVGDQVDSLNRNPDISNWEVLDDVQMLYFTDSLDNIAKTKGGRVISLIGNHELMNVIGNFSYVSPKSNYAGRYEQFKPTGTLSKILGKRPLVVKIGQLFFCHAGIRKAHIDVLESLGKPIEYINEIWRQLMLTGRIDISDKPILDHIILDAENGILWTRNVDSEENADIVMKKIGCQYVFIGHNPVDGVKLVNNRLWLTDTMISRAFGVQSYQYVDVNDFAISVKTISES